MMENISRQDIHVQTVVKPTVERAPVQRKVRRSWRVVADIKNIVLSILLNGEVRV